MPPNDVKLIINMIDQMDTYFFKGDKINDSKNYMVVTI